MQISYDGRVALTDDEHATIMSIRTGLRTVMYGTNSAATLRTLGFQMQALADQLIARQEDE